MLITDNGNDIPKINRNSKMIIKGRITIVTGGKNLKAIKNMLKTIISSDNMMSDVILALMGGISIGNLICNKIELLDCILFRANCVPLTNIFHIIKPSNRYNGKYSIDDLNTLVKTMYSTERISSGSKRVQINPNTEFLYLTFRSARAKSHIMERLFHISLFKMNSPSYL
jgi:hypothetical protein